MHWIVFLALPLIAALAAQYTSVTQTLGAHPFWADKVIWIGLPLGIAMAWFAAFLRFGQLATTVLCLLLAGTSFMLAHAAKEAFAASYAESAFAGRFWYFGWIATCAFVASALATIGRPPPRDH